MPVCLHMYVEGDRCSHPVQNPALCRVYSFTSGVALSSLLPALDNQQPRLAVSPFRYHPRQLCVGRLQRVCLPGKGGRRALCFAPRNALRAPSTQRPNTPLPFRASPIETLLPLSRPSSLVTYRVQQPYTLLEIMAEKPRTELSNNRREFHEKRCQARLAERDLSRRPTPGCEHEKRLVTGILLENIAGFVKDPRGAFKYRCIEPPCFENVRCHGDWGKVKERAGNVVLKGLKGWLRKADRPSQCHWRVRRGIERALLCNVCAGKMISVFGYMLSEASSPDNTDAKGQSESSCTVRTSH